jgi:two-component system, NarL family, response regulator NreC
MNTAPAKLTPIEGPPRVPRVPLQVVIVDDSARMRHALRALLDDDDAIIVTGEASDLSSARELLAEQHADVLVLDLSLPDGSSLRALRALRAASPGTQIVIASMDNTPGLAQRALAAGALGYVLKEYADEDLRAAVHAAARGDEYLTGQLERDLALARRALTDGRLTVREVEVLRLIALGHTNAEIARKLAVSARTIETHRANIHEKLGLRTRAELVRYALRCGLLES